MPENQYNNSEVRALVERLEKEVKFAKDQEDELLTEEREPFVSFADKRRLTRLAEQSDFDKSKTDVEELVFAPATANQITADSTPEQRLAMQARSLGNSTSVLFQPFENRTGIANLGFGNLAGIDTKAKPIDNSIQKISVTSSSDYLNTTHREWPLLRSIQIGEVSISIKHYTKENKFSAEIYQVKNGQETFVCKLAKPGQTSEKVTAEELIYLISERGVVPSRFNPEKHKDEQLKIEDISSFTANDENLSDSAL